MSNGWHRDKLLFAGTLVGHYLVNEEIIGRLLVIKRSAEAFLRYQVECQGLKSVDDFKDQFLQQLAKAVSELNTNVFDEKVESVDLLDEVIKQDAETKPEGFLCPYLRQLSNQFTLVPKTIHGKTEERTP